MGKQATLKQGALERRTSGRHNRKSSCDFKNKEVMKRLYGAFGFVISASLYGQAEAQATAPRRDSAGIAIVQTSAAAASAGIGWTVSSTASVQIGQSSDDPRYHFSVITGLARLRNGQIVVVDAGSRDVRYFDSEGALVRRVGRQGPGPGEFQRPFLVSSPASDSVIVVDNALSRITTLDGEGEIASMRSLQMAFGTPIGIPTPQYMVLRSRTLPAAV